jgi:hypothetical protein
VATPDLAGAIADAVAEPASASGDGQSATARSIDDMIRADQHLAAKRAGARALRGVQVTQLLGTPALDDGNRPPRGFDGGLR